MKLIKPPEEVVGEVTIKREDKDDNSSTRHG